MIRFCEPPNGPYKQDTATATAELGALDSAKGETYELSKTYNVETSARRAVDQ